jgi:hypothetical protein
MSRQRLLRPATKSSVADQAEYGAAIAEVRDSRTCLVRGEPETLRQDSKWLDRASATLIRHWRKKNEKRGLGGGEK